VNPTEKHVAIRPMAAGDVARAMEIAASLPDAPHWPGRAYEDALSRDSSPQRIALVAVSEQAGTMQGFIVASFLPPQAELETIAVAVNCQRRGVGRELFDALVRELKGRGVAEILLEVRASNRAAQAFYRSAGFGKTGMRRAYYIDPVEDAVLMAVKLP